MTIVSTISSFGWYLIFVAQLLRQTTRERESARSGAFKLYMISTSEFQWRREEIKQSKKTGHHTFITVLQHTFFTNNSGGDR